MGYDRCSLTDEARLRPIAILSAYFLAVDVPPMPGFMTLRGSIALHKKKP